MDSVAQILDVSPRTDQSIPILIQYWLIFLRRKYIVASFLVLFLVGGLIVTLLMTPQYTATARIEISRSKQNITKVEGLDSEEASKDLEFYQTQYSLLEARSLAERVATKLKLAGDGSFYSAFELDREGETLFGDAPRSADPVQRKAELAKVVNVLLANIDIKPIRDSSLVDVGFRTPDPELSAKIANTWTEQFIQANLDRRFASTADARRFLEGRLEQLRGRLEQSERDLVDYASNRQIITLSTSESPDGKTRAERTLVASNLEALNSELAQATADRIRAESRARQGSARTGLAGNRQEDAALYALRTKRAEIASEYSRLLIQFEPQYPAAAAVASQVSALDRSIAVEEARIRSGNTAEYREALLRERQLKMNVEQLKNELIHQRRGGIQYNIYQREVDTNRQLYDGLLQRYKEIGVAGVGSNNVAIVDAARVPGTPSSPNLPLNLLIALLLGGVAAGAVVFALEQIDERMLDPAEVSSSLGLPLLGTIPLARGGDILDELDDQKSATSEAYFSVQTSLAFSTDHGVPRSFLITSTRPAEGKSTTSVALARILARMGRSVVIVDADMRSPSLHTYVGGSNSKGLSNFLTGGNLTNLIERSPLERLDILTAGPPPPNPAELLSGTRMTLLVQQLLEKYDNVVVDSPPVLGLADALLLSSAVEGVVYAVGANGARGRIVRTALARLAAARASIIGVVFTRFDTQKTHYGYGYDYGYGYGSEGKSAA